MTSEIISIVPAIILMAVLSSITSLGIDSLVTHFLHGSSVYLLSQVMLKKQIPRCNFCGWDFGVASRVDMH